MNINIFKICNVFILIFLCNIGINAQHNFTATGGEATGARGKVSYSVGQLVYKTHSSESASVAEGVQQPYEISVLTGDAEIISSKFNYTVFPNPTKGMITLKTDELNEADLMYKLLTNYGILIKNQKISETETNIDLKTLPPGTYILCVFESEVMVSNFKIILSY